MRSRMTVVETVYHQPKHAQAVAFASSWGRDLMSEDQPYVRNVAVGAEWQPLDTGWVRKSGTVVIHGGKGAVELGFGGEVFAQVRPGESCRFDCPRLDSLLIRGEGRVTINVVPC